jgi:hypothetical protein
MNGLQTANAPSPKIVVPHFVAGSLAFVIATCLLLISAGEWHNLYFHPKLIAITHIMILGWATMTAFGALYQLIPVVYETSLFSEKLASATFYLYTISVIFLSYSFWVSSFSELLLYSSLLMFFSLLLFIINLAMTYRKRTKSNIQSRFISTALLWLAFTELLGTIVALNFKYNFLSQNHIHYLKIHAHLGLLGWFILLIIGASSILIPMFMISHKVKSEKLKYSYYLINIGLSGLILNWFISDIRIGEILFSLSIVGGIIIYIVHIFQLYKTRIRKKLDTGMKMTMSAIVLMLLPSLISLIISGINFDYEMITSLSLIYGFGIIFGIISTIILGQIYKTLPFIIWLKIYQPHVGKFKTPLPRELYSETILKTQMIIYLTGYGTVLSGIGFQHLFTIKTGIFLIIITSVLNLINVIKITFHKPNLINL